MTRAKGLGFRVLGAGDREAECYARRYPKPHTLNPKPCANGVIF